MAKCVIENRTSRRDNVAGQHGIPSLLRFLTVRVILSSIDV